MGETIKRLRIEKGTTQAEAAEAVGVSLSAWGLYELGERIPRDDVKVRVADYLGKSIKYIFFS